LDPIREHGPVGARKLRVLHWDATLPQLLREPPQPVIPWPVMLKAVEQEYTGLGHEAIMVAACM
jgi:hypothetical protein